MTTCTVCIATYKRNEGLRDLLESLERQVLEPDVVVDIIVVDNDPDSARDTVDEFRKASRFDVHYYTQPEQNISLTRNLAVRMAVGDLIWFVDDDETATPAALSELLDAMKRFDADGVFGPVLPTFEGSHPSWILTSSAFNRSIHETGRRARAFRTSNTLVSAAVLQKVSGPFDPSYGLSGGSDSMLFRQLELLGAKFIDCGEGAVVETVPESRANWPWIRDRVRRQGQNHGRQTVSLTGSVANPSVLVLLVKATMQIVAMAPIVALGKRHSHRRAEAHMRLWSNIGKVEGVAGVVTTRSL